MRVIPVIDLKGGLAVRAIRGDRENYQPIATPLAPDATEPLSIAGALLGVCPAFDSLYVADIDGIVGRPRNAGLRIAAKLAAAVPGIRILFDNGCSGPDDLAGMPKASGIIPVIGTETLSSAGALAEIAMELSGNLALSLDWRADQRLGLDEVYEQSALWPQTVIVMTLDRVGAGAGPDFKRLQQVKALAGSREVLAAGGVRGLDDLHALKEMGCGALVATALHDGSLRPADLAELLET
ncbi:MAG: nickel transporter [Alphaproteobacteria bacterium]|nr:nickel transporter [Alphaproteobacteria bacterium]